MRVSLVLAFLLVVAPGCDRFSRPAGKDTYVKVGNIPVTWDMVRLRKKILADDPRVLDADMAAKEQLVYGMLSAGVASSYGMPVSETAVKHFFKAQEHQFPRRVKELEQDTANQDFFVVSVALPDYANQLVRGIYYADDTPHQSEADKVQAVLSRAIVAPERFEQIAAEEALPVDHLWIGPEELRSDSSVTQGRVATQPVSDVTRQARAPSFGEEERQVAAALFSQLGATQTGQVHPRAIQTPDAFQVVKIEKREPARLRIGLITVAKKPYDEWFWSLAERIPVEFTNPEEGRAFIKRVPYGKKLLVRGDLYADLLTGPTQPPR